MKRVIRNMTNEIRKLLGVDWGEKRIGLAIGDSETNLASPFKVVSDIDEIVSIIKQENINKVVVGQPVKMSGNKELSVDFNKFIKLLKSKTTTPVELVDERLSSKQADALLGNKKTKAAQDAIAAMLILQTYLDQQN